MIPGEEHLSIRGWTVRAQPIGFYKTPLLLGSQWCSSMGHNICVVPGGHGFGFQVCFLEQRNQVLQTKWKLQQQLDLSNCRRSLEPLYEAHISNLRKQLEALSGERVQLNSDLRNMRDVVEDYKKRLAGHQRFLGHGPKLQGWEVSSCGLWLWGRDLPCDR